MKMAEKSQIKIKNGKKDRVLKFVTSAISLFKSGSPTKLASKDEYKFKQYVYALSNLIEIQNIKNFNDAQIIIEKAIYKSKDYSSLTLEDFKSCLYEAKKEIIERPCKTYYIVFPLKIKYNSMKKRQFNLLDTKITVHSYKYIQKNFNYDKLKERAQRDKNIKENLKPILTYFIIEEHAKNEYEAGYSAYDKLELLRSIINFIYQYKKLNYQLIGKPKPLSLIYPPKVFFTFDSNKKYLDTWMTDLTYDTKEIDFNSSSLKSHNIIKKSERLVKKLNSLKKSGLKDMIIESLYLYNNALDHYDKKWLSFLSFWQIFELITLASKCNLRQNVVCERILSLLREKDPYEDIVDVLRKKRNKLVHEGKYRDFAEKDIHMIKGLVEESILFLIYAAPKLKNINGLDFFYRNLHISKDEFKLRTSVLKYIRKINDIQYLE